MKKILNILLGCSILLASCKPGDFGTLNYDQTKVTRVPTSALLTNAIQITLPLTTFGPSAANSYVQYMANATAIAEYGGIYFPWSSSFDVNAKMYDGPLNNLQTIIDMNNENDPMSLTSGFKDNQVAVSRILKAYYFWSLTDRYGDIPYSEALKGNGNYTPKYDLQKDIYYDLFKEFKEASAQIDEGQLGVVGDILFKGDMTKWKMFANTCRMMMALRLIKNDFEKGKTEFNEALTAGSLTSNADNVIYYYIANDPNNYNPFYQAYAIEADNGTAIASTIVDFMETQHDPRLPVYGEDLNGIVVGSPFGIKQNTVLGSFSRPGKSPCTTSSCPDNFFRSAGAPSPIFSYAQVLFTLAEAAKIGYISGGDAEAATYYADGIQASFEYYGVYDDTGYANFMAQSDVAYDPANGLKQIMDQKWVHLFLNGYESWTDWRRTGYPELIPAANGAIAVIPRRQGYPIDEVGVNPIGYKAAVERQGPDDLETRIWWDK
ncbi:MAG: SusD/RagB family nutrient-binding outer membrane lipoprotein [Flavitalea sp.]